MVDAQELLNSFSSIYNASFCSFFYDNLESGKTDYPKTLDLLKTKVQEVFDNNKKDDFEYIFDIDMNLSDHAKIELLNIYETANKQILDARKDTVIQEVCLKIVSECPFMAVGNVRIESTEDKTKIHFISSSLEILRKSKLAISKSGEGKIFANLASITNLIVLNNPLGLNDRIDLIKPFAKLHLTKWKIGLAVATIGLFVLAVVIYKFVQAIFIHKYIQEQKLLEEKVESLLKIDPSVSKIPQHYKEKKQDLADKLESLDFVKLGIYAARLEFLNELKKPTPSDASKE